MPQWNRAAVRRALDRLSLDELQSMAFDLGYDFEGKDKIALVLGLPTWLEGRGRETELGDWLAENRPDIDTSGFWPTSSAPATAPAADPAPSSPRYEAIVQSEIRQRLEDVLDILDRTGDQMKNEDALRVMDLLDGKSGGGRPDLAGRATDRLMRELRDAQINPRLPDSLIDSLKDLYWTLRTRPEEGRIVGRVQVLDYGRIGEVREEIRQALGRPARRAPPLLKPKPDIPIPEMVTVPAGTFLRGTSDQDIDWLVKNTKWAQEWVEKGHFKAEQPQRKVYLSAFEIGRYPVTNRAYAAFIQATGRTPPRHWQSQTPPDTLLDHPVVYVSWDDAVAYCRWLSEQTGQIFRLPTEAEWEKAARGTDGRHWPWGNQFDAQKCNSREAGLGTTTPVGRYSPQGDSPYGNADMAGNVWEWCADWFDEGYYAQAPDQDPRGPVQGNSRALRGCSWLDVEDLLRAAPRNYGDPTSQYDDIGFRCARSS